MIPPIQSPHFLSEWTDAIVHLQLEHIKILLNFDPQLLWTQLPYTLDYGNELYIELIQSLRLGSSVQPLSALQYCIIQYHQPENREEKYNIISYLIEKSTVEDLNTHYWGDCNNSTIHLVCFMGQLDVLDLLLKKGVYTSIKNDLGFSPCHVASNQAILDGISFYEQKREQQERDKNSGTNTALQKFKLLRDLAEGSMNNKPTNRPTFNPHYFRTGHVKEAKKFLTTEVQEERRRAQTHMEEVAQLAKKLAVKNNLKQFEQHEDLLPQRQQQDIIHRRRLSFHPIMKSSESSISKRDSAIISALKKNTLVSSSILRQQLNDGESIEFTDDSIIAELYSSRPSTIIEERLSEEEKRPEVRGTMDSTTIEEKRKQEPEVFHKDQVNKQEDSTAPPPPDIEYFPSTTESILDAYTPASLDIEMCRKALHETKIIEDEIDLLLAETEASSSNSDGDMSSDGYSDDESIYISSEEVWKEDRCTETEVGMHQDLEQQENMYRVPSLQPITPSSFTPSFCIDREYDDMESRKHSCGSQKSLWTTSMILWSSNLDDGSNKSEGSSENQFNELYIEEEEQYQNVEQRMNDETIPTISKEKEQEKEQEQEEQEEEVEEDFRRFRNTLDISDEDMTLMIRSSSIRKSAERGGPTTIRSSADLNVGLLSTEDLLSGASSARSSSSIKTMDAIFYMPDPPDRKQPDDISDFYPPPPPPTAPVMMEMPPPEDYHTCEEKQGKLHVHIRGVQDIKLPLPKEPTLVRCVVSDGRFEYMTDYKILDTDIEFDHKCSIDIYPGMSITVSLHVHPDYISVPKAPPLMSLLRKQRNCFSNYISKVDGAIGLAFCDISNCLPVCHEEYYRASICCFNTWYARSFIERHTRKRNTLNEDLLDIAGKFDLDMFYSPA
ncbi:hypothetical protein K501DRAFT_329837 [Backusella circina FSU 941]|nr:hypothetical protein K501DRAFT_329837 [Backusella circina FSU 941]